MIEITCLNKQVKGDSDNVSTVEISLTLVFRFCNDLLGVSQAEHMTIQSPPLLPPSFAESIEPS